MIVHVSRASALVKRTLSGLRENEPYKVKLVGYKLANHINHIKLSRVVMIITPVEAQVFSKIY